MDGSIRCRDAAGGAATDATRARWRMEPSFEAGWLSTVGCDDATDKGVGGKAMGALMNTGNVVVGGSDLGSGDGEDGGLEAEKEEGRPWD